MRCRTIKYAKTRYHSQNRVGSGLDYFYEFYFTAVKNSLGILSITQPFFLIG